MIAITYRMLGSFSEAEEVVQDVALEWHKTEADPNPKAALSTTNKALDALESLQEEVCQGFGYQVLPESLIYWENDLEKSESLKASFLLVLKT